MNSYRSKIGKNGETIAENFLKKRGFFILEKNYKTPFGEIDIIAKNGTEIVFFEVKTRVSEKFGTPLEAINTEKKKHILKNCLYFIKKNRQENQPCRIDAIGIKLNAKGDLEILKHVRNAIEILV